MPSQGKAIEQEDRMIVVWRGAVAILGTARARRWAAGLALAVGVLGGSASAQAFSFRTFSISPSTTLAAAHPNVTITTSFTYSDSSDTVKGLQVFFPAGLVGNPNVVSKCTTTQLAADACPASSQIGTVTVSATAIGIVGPVTAPGSVYNVAPTGSEPARIGMVIRPLGGVLGKSSMSGPVTVQIPGDQRLISTFTNLPKTLPPLLGIVPVPIQINSISLTLDGLVNGGTAAFMTNPTSCGPATGVAVASSYENSTGGALLGGFTPSDCAHVPFSPGIGFSYGSLTASTPSSLNVAVTVPAAELPRRQAHVLASTVLLPLGTGINPAAFATLTQCTDTQLATNSAAPATCPATSQVGTVTFSTPLLGNLPGKVFFATGTTANPLRLFIEINVDGLWTKLIANNSFYGPFIVSTLSGLPQVPFTTFTLSFTGGPNALVTTPPCGVQPGIGIFTPWSGNPYQVIVSNVTISQTSTGAPCPSTSGSTSTAHLATASKLASAVRTTPRGGLSETLTRVLGRRTAGGLHR
jgi:hypothetical protein